MKDDGKPLGKKSYGHIGHLPGSRLGAGDHHVNEGQARCMTVESPRGDRIIVQEKLDGSNVGVCKKDGKIVPLVRAGWDARTSKREMHHMFARWAMNWEPLFDGMLGEGDRVCGEWLAQAHGTKYDLAGRWPFVAFDIFTADDERLTFDEFNKRADWLARPPVFHDGGALPLNAAKEFTSQYGAIDPIEGVVYRWERKGRVLMLAKFVHPYKADGCYLADDVPPIWNWKEAP